MATYGCEKCGLFFEARDALDEHASNHTGNSTVDPTQHNDISVDERESTFLKRTMEVEKARKRTRGPYRKSAAA